MWREHPSVVPLESGGRGDGRDAGRVGLEDFSAGAYPSCSKHGALIAVGGGKWRCITGRADCNVGATWTPVAVQPNRASTPDEGRGER